MKTKSTISNIVKYIFLCIVLVITIFPLIYTISSSFKTNIEIMTEPWKVFPSHPTLDNYITAFNSKDFNVPLMFFNSLWYTLCSVLIALVVASMAGYVFARGEFPGKNIVFGCFVSLMFIQLGGVGIYATFEILSALHIQRSLYSLLLLKVFGVPIVNIYLVRGYISNIPKAIDESAKIDGCSFFGIYRHIILPLIGPIMATIAILSFQGSWNEYIMPNIFTLTRPEQQTLIVGLMHLKNSDGAATSWNLMLAGTTITLIPVLVAYSVANKYFVSGLSAGAVKE